MKSYNEMRNGERQKCPHCEQNQERSNWFLAGEICDWCLDNNKPCAICNKLKPCIEKYEVNEVICSTCKDKLKKGESVVN